jgi:hypothetical protein
MQGTIYFNRRGRDVVSDLQLGCLTELQKNKSENKRWKEYSSNRDKREGTGLKQDNTAENTDNKKNPIITYGSKEIQTKKK